VDEARKLKGWMMADNIGSGEAIGVKYVPNEKMSSQSLLVWKRCRRRQRPGSGVLRSLRTTERH
jgi:hypothetical protein